MMTPTLSLLDRLIDDRSQPQITPACIRKNLKRDLENLLNTRRSWHLPHKKYTDLATSVLGYGLPDFTLQEMLSGDNIHWLCNEVQRTIQRFEPRLCRVSVTLQETPEIADRLLRLQIDAVLVTDTRPEPITFQSEVEVTSLSMTLSETRI